MSVPLLSDLREPPVVGRFYMVPVIREYPWHGRTDTWPIIGALHEDLDFFHFKELHYHIDARFMTARQERFAARQTHNSDFRYEPHDPEIVAISGSPLAYRGTPLPKGRPGLMRRKCRRATYGAMTLKVHTRAREKFDARYGKVADPIRKRDGRLLCPHRKVDLSQFIPDADGIVTCPLHGLRVRCAA